MTSQFQFVGRRILVAFRLDEFLPDALFDFLVELCVFLRRDHAFGDQGSFHFVSGSPSARFSISSALR